MRLEEISHIPVISAAPASPLSVVIAQGQSLSDVIDLNEQRLHRIAFPAGWDAAPISFQVSATGATFHDLYDAEGELNLSSSVAGANRSVLVDPAAFFGVRYLKVRSGLSSAPVNQGSSRTLTLVTVPR